jgi:phytoene dehydrogenase-like protein
VVDDRRTSDEIGRFSTRDAATFLRVQADLEAGPLPPAVPSEPPRHPRARAASPRALRHDAPRINGDEIGQMVAFLTGSLGDYLDRNFESDKVKTLYLANNVYGKHGGPYQPGTAIGLLFHLLSGGDHDVQGFYGHVIGGMGAITGAMAEAAKGFGAEIRTDAPVARIDTRTGRATG